MRTFIAIELSGEIRSALARIQSHLKYSGADVKWVEEKNIHLTLKFLGEIDENKLLRVKNILDETGKLSRPFEISLKDIGAFPDIDYPRVIWAGLGKGSAESKILAERIDEELSRIGFEKESRLFAAHLTIGRVRSVRNKEALKSKLTAYSLQFTAKPQLISSIILFQSTLTPEGPVYTKLHEAKFV